jgi:outer membrane beta-barrel protein
MRAARAGRWLLFSAALAAAAPPSPARGSEADVFENKIEPVSGVLYPKSGRFEVTPTFNLSLIDPFYSKTLFGAKLGYHLDEYFSIHASFATGPASATGSASVCPANQGCGPATNEQLYQVPGRIRMMAGGEVAFSPIYGKLNLIGEQVAHFDVSILGGADYVVFQKALESGVAQAAAQAGQKPPDASSLAGHVGLGLRIYLYGFVALRLELKDYLYRAEIGNLQRMQWQNQLFADMGLSFFFPTSPRRTP